jgi:hypothetical protein
MNYKKIYDQLIDRSQSENRKKGLGIYFERHHIIPKCLSRGSMSDEHKLNISKSLKNKKKPPRTEEHSKNISKALLLKNKVKSV